MTIKNAMRVFSVFAVLLAGSCAVPLNTTDDIYSPEQLHPITVSPSYESLKLSFSPSEAGLMPDDETHFVDFVRHYIAHGHGAISVSAPDGPDSQAAIHYFGERIAEMGVQPSRILVGTHPATSGNDRVELGYVTYVAHTGKCGDWSENVANTSSNLPMKNFGCATQHNLAVEVADPRDLEAPRPMGASDAERRALVMDNYENGKPTSASKTGDQSVNVSGIQ